MTLTVDREVKSGVILVVDDEEVIRSQIKRFLEHNGFKVVTAESGNKAIAKLTDEHIDFVNFCQGQHTINNLIDTDLINEESSDSDSLSDMEESKN